MPTTPNYALRYPAQTAPPNVPADMQNLATDVEAAIGLPGARGCRYSHTTPVTLATGGAKVPFQTATKLGSLITASGAGNTDFAFGATGWIMMGANIRYGSGITAPYLSIRKGVTELCGNNHTTAADGFVNTGTTTAWYATAGDSFNVFVNLGQSVPLDANGLTNFWLVYVGL